MKIETKLAWISALRSGRYQQAKESLRKDDRFCCLGVFCDLFGGGCWVERMNVVRGMEYVYKSPDGDCMESHLTDTMCAKHGLSVKDMNALATMNDDGDSFQWISNHIEANL